MRLGFNHAAEHLDPHSAGEPRRSGIMLWHGGSRGLCKHIDSHNLITLPALGRSEKTW